MQIRRLPGRSRKSLLVTDALRSLPFKKKQKKKKTRWAGSSHRRPSAPWSESTNCQSESLKFESCKKTINCHSTRLHNWTQSHSDFLSSRSLTHHSGGITVVSDVVALTSRNHLFSSLRPTIFVSLSSFLLFQPVRLLFLFFSSFIFHLFFLFFFFTCALFFPPRSLFSFSSLCCLWNYSFRLFICNIHSCTGLNFLACSFFLSFPPSLLYVFLFLSVSPSSLSFSSFILSTVLAFSSFFLKVSK